MSVKPKKMRTTRLVDVIVHPILDVVSILVGWILVLQEDRNRNRNKRHPHGKRYAH